MSVRLTAEQYLRDRGWTKGPGASVWCDPIHASAPSDGTGTVAPCVAELDAITIQLSRDAAEERRCIADAVSNSASRASRDAPPELAAQRVRNAAVLASMVWREIFAVEIVDGEQPETSGEVAP